MNRLCDEVHNLQKIHNQFRDLLLKLSAKAVHFSNIRLNFLTNFSSQYSKIVIFQQNYFLYLLNIDSISITDAEVYNALNSLNISKAMGPDGIPTQVLKFCSCVISCMK